jgi:two-component system, NarL family, sensor histidine kinase DevS
MVLLTREQLEDRLAALHRASLELVSDLSLETVLERIVKLAREQASARYAALGIMNSSGELEKFIPIGMLEEQVKSMGFPPQGNGLLGILRSDRKTIRIPYIEDDSRSVGFPSNHPHMKSFLGVPVLLGDELLGQIYLTDKLNYHEFTEQDERVIETLAAYAAVAISNARLYDQLLRRDDELSQRNEDLKLINEVASALTGAMDVQEILSKTLEQVIKYLDVEIGEIFLREDGEQELRLSLHQGEFTQTLTIKDRFRLGEGIIGKVAQTGKLVINYNIENGEFQCIHPRIIEEGFHCIACIPLLAGGKVVGVMTAASRREQLYDKREKNLLSAIGSWAGITIENERLNHQARRLAVLEERERIGMDLHDGVIQSIYGVGLALEYIRVAMEEDPEPAKEKINDSIASLNETIRDIRAYILDLRPREFHGEGLLQGLKRLIAEFQTNCATQINLVAPDDGLLDIPAANATAIFHICQEALANVAKHSRAKQAQVHLWTAKERLVLEVSDDGLGFDLKKMSVTLGHGLSNMQARARKVGGDVEITSAMNNGTTVLAWVPRKTI